MCFKITIVFEFQETLGSVKVKGEVHSEGEGECTRVHGYSAVVKGNGKVQIVECHGTAAIFTVGSFEGETISLAPGALVQVCSSSLQWRRPLAENRPLDGAVDFQSKI